MRLWIVVLRWLCFVLLRVGVLGFEVVVVGVVLVGVVVEVIGVFFGWDFSLGVGGYWCFDVFLL